MSAWADAQVLRRDLDGSAGGTDAAVPQPEAATRAAAESDAALRDAARDDAPDDHDAGAMAPAPDAAVEAVDPSKPCTFELTTLSQGGRYAPKNIGAIWIARADGTWVKTLALWASVRLRYLEAYRAVNTTGNKVDAVTSSTLRMHKAHSVSWNLRDAQGLTVPEGDYRVQVEVTDDDKAGQTLSLPFKKTSGAIQANTANTDVFHDIQLRCR